MTINSSSTGSVSAVNRLVRFQIIYRRAVFMRKLRQAYGRFIQQYPQWRDGLFDYHFLTHSAAPLWENYIGNGVWPTTNELVAVWRTQIGVGQAAIRPEYIVVLKTAVADFLAQLKVSLPATH